MEICNKKVLMFFSGVSKWKKKEQVTELVLFSTKKLFLNILREQDISIYIYIYKYIKNIKNR